MMSSDNLSKSQEENWCSLNTLGLFVSTMRYRAFAFERTRLRGRVLGIAEPRSFSAAKRASAADRSAAFSAHLGRQRAYERKQTGPLFPCLLLCPTVERGACVVPAVVVYCFA